MDMYKSVRYIYAYRIAGIEGPEELLKGLYVSVYIYICDTDHRYTDTLVKIHTHTKRT